MGQRGYAGCYVAHPALWWCNLRMPRTIAVPHWGKGAVGIEWFKLRNI